MVVLEHPSPAADDAPGVPRVPRLGPPQGWGFGGQRQSHSCCGSHLPSYTERDEPASTEAAGIAVRSVLRSAMESGFRATQGAAPAPPPSTEMLEKTPAMDEVEGRILHTSLLSLCCPWVPQPLLDGSWEMASGLWRARGRGVGCPKASPARS